MSNNNNKTMSFDDFVAYREMHNYIFLPSRAPWPAASIDAELPPVPLLDDKGKPVIDKKTSKPVLMPAHGGSINIARCIR